jgi:two-component system capsular synthesis sensor histidine kinase RcsC
MQGETMPQILVVDDEKLSRDILVRLLNHFQQEIDVASTAEEALSFIEQKHFDFAILDLAMPQMDGWQLLTHLQEISLPAVALTAFYDPQVAREAKNAGFLACYPKPANSKIIEEIISMIPS